MRALAVLALLALPLAGCLAAPEPQPLAPSEAAPAAALPEAPVLAEFPWDGRITASQLGMLAHNRDTEPLVGDVQREGFVFDVTELPQDYYVKLAWPGPGEALIMVSTPHVDGQGVEYFTDFSSEAEQCLRVPPEGFMTGAWQVMIHTRGATQADFTFTVVLAGGAGSILEGEPHSAAEAAETTDGEALACDAPAAEPEA